MNCNHMAQGYICDEPLDTDGKSFQRDCFCPDCGQEHYVALVQCGCGDDTGETVTYISVSPAWHERIVNQTTEALNEAYAQIRANADSRAALAKTYAEQIDAMLEQRDKAVEHDDIMTKELAYRCEVMQDVCRLLAACATYDLNGKNEQILQAIDLLLTYSQSKTRFTRNLHDNMTTIPF